MFGMFSVWSLVLWWRVYNQKNWTVIWGFGFRGLGFEIRRLVAGASGLGLVFGFGSQGLGFGVWGLEV